MGRSLSLQRTCVCASPRSVRWRTDSDRVTKQAAWAHLISDEAQPASGRWPNAVIPGLPARAEPGIQSSFDLQFWVPLRGVGITS
jgi:hypothetical protein